MSTETERLAREAEHHRVQVDDTIDRLKDKLSIGQIVDELSGYLREGQGAEMVQNFNRQVRDNPLALGLVGAGVAWLFLGHGVRDEDDRRYERRDGYRGAAGAEGRDRRSNAHSIRGASSGISNAASSMAGSVSDTTSSIASGVTEGANSAGRTITGAAQSAGSAVSDAAGAASETVSHAYHNAQDATYGAAEAAYRSSADAGHSVARYAHRARRTFLDTLHEEPLIIGAVALAIGAAIGAALPPTRREDRLFGQQRDELRDEAIDYGSETLEKVEHVVSEAYEAGSEEAERKGLKPEAEGETLAEKVSAVAGKTAEAAKNEAKKEGLV